MHNIGVNKTAQRVSSIANLIQSSSDSEELSHKDVTPILNDEED